MNNNFIKEIGRSFIVSSFLPASLFVSLILIFFLKDFSPLFTKTLVDYPFFMGNSWILAVIFTFWLAFMLYSGVEWTMKFFEGYYFPEPIYSYLKEKQAETLTNNYRSIQNYLDELEKKPIANTDQEIKHRNELFEQALADLQSLEISLPLKTDWVLPTALGNVLRASELYPRERYGLEGITIWPRLHKVLPLGIVRELEEKNNQLIFLLNSSLLFYSISIVSLILSLGKLIIQFGRIVLESPNSRYIIRPFSPEYLNAFPLYYIIIGATFFLAGYSIYRISINVAEGYGLIIRSGFDLYRFNLLKQMHFHVPQKYENEKNIWERINELLIAGTRLRHNFDDLEYVYARDFQGFIEKGEKESNNTAKEQNRD